MEGCVIVNNDTKDHSCECVPMLNNWLMCAEKENSDLSIFFIIKCKQKKTRKILSFLVCKSLHYLPTATNSPHFKKIN